MRRSCFLVAKELVRVSHTPTRRLLRLEDFCGFSVEVLFDDNLWKERDKGRFQSDAVDLAGWSFFAGREVVLIKNWFHGHPVSTRNG